MAVKTRKQRRKKDSPRADSAKTYVIKHKKKKPLFYGRVEVGESNDPYLPFHIFVCRTNTMINIRVPDNVGFCAIGSWTKRRNCAELEENKVQAELEEKKLQAELEEKKLLLQAEIEEHKLQAAIEETAKGRKKIESRFEREKIVKGSSRLRKYRYKKLQENVSM